MDGNNILNFLKNRYITLTGFGKIFVISIGFKFLMVMHDQPIEMGVIICYVIS